MAERRRAAVDDTVREINVDSNAKLHNAQIKIKDCYRQLLDEEKVRFAISPMYAPYVGDSMCISINGYPIWVPVNGQSYDIPKSYANIGHEMIQRIDDKLRASKRMSDIANNVETFAGARSLITKSR